MSIDEMKARIAKALEDVAQGEKILTVRKNKLAFAKQELADATATLKPGDVIAMDSGRFASAVIERVCPPPAGYEDNMHGYVARGIKKNGEVASQYAAEVRIAEMLKAGTLKKTGEMPVPEPLATNEA